ncbi:MAG: LON peptidase substrate-binding domain-containing protein [Chloroflexi bacterium]|nr:LON peptidase substrate-binding domain-containing protein [Chloroflexota bacterium]
MNRTLPLFPLNTVLFPGAPASLQIFEPRYREMLRDCMAADRRFGVVLIKSGTETGAPAVPHRVGTVARITTIGAPRRGAIPVEAVGEGRFEILSEDRIRPYLSATVRLIEDDPTGTASDELVVSAHAATERYLGAMLASRGVYAKDTSVPSDPTELSFYVGSIMGSAENQALQKILEIRRLSDRLKEGMALMADELDQLQPTFMRSGPGKERALFSSN